MRLRPLWLAAGFAFVGLVVYLSLTPDPLQIPAPEGVKLNHILAYGWLMFWFAQLFAGGTRLGIALALALMGVALEVLQGMTPYRVFSYSDMIQNAIGVGAGWLVSRTRAGRMLAAIEARLRS